VLWMQLDPGLFPTVPEHQFLYASRFPHLWMVPAIARTELHQPNLKKHLTAAQIENLTATQDRFMVEDIQHWQPALIGVERCADPAMEVCEGMHGGRIDLLEWFSHDAGFRQEWSHYQLVETAGRYDFYALKK